MEKKKIFVTRPFLPPQEEFNDLLRKLWESRNLTNYGDFHIELEKKIAEYLGVRYLSLVSNGTLALMIALQALEIKGEVITTPYSFVATTHAILWNKLKPVFSDISANDFNLDPEKIEVAITPKTSAILPVHVYGNPCNTEVIKRIANKYGLKIIYDAAHTFDVRINNTPVLNNGDLSIMSFHATKVYTTFEGGAIISHDEQMKKRIDHLKNFGYAGETRVVGPGINAKMSEVQAAMGLLQLKYIQENIQKRKKVATLYRELLSGIGGLKYFEDIPNVKHCYAYFPILINEKVYGKARDQVFENLKDHGIFTRRYFYPLISQFPCYSKLSSAKPSNLPIAEMIAQQILCLPIYHDLEEEDIQRICLVLKNK